MPTEAVTKLVSEAGHLLPIRIIGASRTDTAGRIAVRDFTKHAYTLPVRPIMSPILTRELPNRNSDSNVPVRILLRFQLCL